MKKIFAPLTAVLPLLYILAIGLSFPFHTSDPLLFCLLSVYLLLTLLFTVCFYFTIHHYQPKQLAVYNILFFRRKSSAATDGSRILAGKKSGNPTTGTERRRRRRPVTVDLDYFVPAPLVQLFYGTDRRYGFLQSQSGGYLFNIHKTSA